MDEQNFAPRASQGAYPAAREKFSDSVKERWAWIACFAVLAALKIAYTLHYRADSDETQHLHVVWGWTQGMLPYRDFFDNHSPLFQAACAPLLGRLGERADILIPMRLAMLPLFAISLFAIYKIAVSLFSPRVARWSVVIAGLWPNFLLTTSEFRTDNGWCALWFLALALLTREKFSTPQALLLGLVFGALFGISMKTTLMLLALALSWATIAAIRLLEREKIDWRERGKWLAAWLAGASIAPVAIALFFASKGALYSPEGAHNNLFYCVFTHNALPGLGKWHQHWFHKTWFPLAVPAMFLLAQKYLRDHAGSALAQKRALLFLAAGFYFFPMRSYWPLITRQDFLPLSPLLCLGAAVVVLKIADAAGAKISATRTGFSWLPALLVLGEIALVFNQQAPWQNRAIETQHMLAVLLRTLDKNDTVMDAKGETVFRKRAAPEYVLEGITNDRFKNGLLTDDIAEKIIATRTCIATTARMPERTKNFVTENFLPFYGYFRVVGRAFDEVKKNQRFEFDVKIPTRYAVVTRGGVRAAIDGQPVGAPRFLASGTHTLDVLDGAGSIRLAWAQAVARGYDPFQPMAFAQKED